MAGSEVPSERTVESSKEMSHVCGCDGIRERGRPSDWRTQNERTGVVMRKAQSYASMKWWPEVNFYLTNIYIQHLSARYCSKCLQITSLNSTCQSEVGMCVISTLQMRKWFHRGWLNGSTGIWTHLPVLKDPRVCKIGGRTVLGDHRCEILQRWEGCLPKNVYFIF